MPTGSSVDTRIIGRQLCVDIMLLCTTETNKRCDELVCHEVFNSYEINIEFLNSFQMMIIDCMFYALFYGLVIV